jgi:hypothetical protein
VAQEKAEHAEQEEFKKWKKKMKKINSIQDLAHGSRTMVPAPRAMMAASSTA